MSHNVYGVFEDPQIISIVDIKKTFVTIFNMCVTKVDRGVEFLRNILLAFCLHVPTTVEADGLGCRKSFDMLKVIYAAFVVLAVSGFSRGANANEVETAWGLFSEKCQQFLDSPVEFLNRSDRDIPNWKWIVREEQNTGFFEYLSVPSDSQMQLSVIRDAGIDNDYLHCSISIFSGGQGRLEKISRLLSGLTGVQQLGGVVDFPNLPGMSNDLKQYYSTSNRTSLAGFFDGQNVATQVRVDDAGSIYFEVQAVRAAE